MGLLSTSHWSEYYGSTVALDSLLGIRYVVLPTLQSLNNTYEEVFTDHNNSVYKNPYALPIMYACAAGVGGYDISLRSSPLIRQNEIIRAMLGGVAPDCFIPLAAELSYENALLEAMDIDGTSYHAIYSNVYLENEADILSGAVYAGDLVAPETTISFKTTVQQDGMLYFYIETAFENKLEIFLNDEYYGTLYGDDNFVKGLGDYKAGDVVTVKLQMKECSHFFFPADTVAFYLEDAAATAENLLALAENGIILSDFREDYFLGNITATEARPTVQTTIPYDAGWIVTVDGEPVETYKTLGALLAFDLTPGEHTVELRYRPRAYVVGMTISLCALALFLALVTVEALVRRGVICPRKGSVTEAVTTFLFCADKIEEEPNYLAYHEETEETENEGESEHDG